MKITHEMLENLKNRAHAYHTNWGVQTVKAWMEMSGQSEMSELMRQADLLLKDTFVFADLWDMEPCVTMSTLHPLAWNQTPNGDPEWAFMLNRHEYFKKLLLAQMYTEKSIYGKKLKQLLFHWIRNNSLSDAPGLSMRTIDTGIRCAAWLPLVLHLVAQGQLDDRELSIILQSVLDQFIYLKNSYVEKYTLSNWGILQTTAICQWQLWLGEWMDDALYKWARKMLKKQLELQIYEDGSHWEQSIMYHMEVLNACSNLLILAKQLGQQTDPAIGEVLKGMYHYVQMAAGPDGYQQAQGDSDRTDVRDVMVRGALLYGDETLRYCGFAEINLDNVWLFGAPGIQTYGQMKTSMPTEERGLFHDSGNYYFRTSWKSTASYTYLKNGSLGSSHGHVDMGHLSIYYQGKLFLVDCGRYSYVEREPLREKLKGAQAHNVCVVTDAGEGQPHGSWGYKCFGDCLKNYVKSIDDIHYAELPFVSRAPQGSLCFHNRRVWMFQEGIWLTIDDLRMDGAQESKLFYHLAPEVEVKQYKNKPGEITLYRDGLELTLGCSGHWIVEKGVLSERYNEICSHLVVTSTKNWKDEGYMVSWLLPSGFQIRKAEIYQAEKEMPCSDQEVLAWEIVSEGEVRYVAIIFLHEVCKGRKLFLYKGKEVYGKSVVLKRISEEQYRILRFRT